MKKKSSAKKTVKVVRKSSARKTGVLQAKTKTSYSGMLVVAAILGIVVITGLYFYNQNQAKPADIFVVSQPNSFSFSDRFGDGVIAKERWSVHKSDGVNVGETQSDNLRIVIPGGAVAGKARTAILNYKELVSDGRDFSMNTRLYKPVVEGSGVGRVGIRFGGGEGADSEGVALYWEVSGSSSEIVFDVNAAGRNVRTQRIVANGRQMQLMIKRIGNEYSAYYRTDNFDDDNPFITLGESVVSEGQTGGRIRIFASNSGSNGAYPKVVSRVDSVGVTSNSSNQVVSDGFSQNGEVDGSKWSINKRGKVDVKNTNGNLVMRLDAANRSSENPELQPSVLRMVSNADIMKDKRGMAVVEMIKPNVVGGGTGIMGLSFNSESDKNDESVSIRWVVSGENSKLVFVAKDGKGKLEERESVNLGSNRNRVTVKLVHGDGKYTAMYRVGPGLDDDSGFKAIGTVNNPRMGARGAFSIFTTHVVVGNQKAPEVTGKFDSFRVSYY